MSLFTLYFFMVLLPNLHSNTCVLPVLLIVLGFICAIVHLVSSCDSDAKMIHPVTSKAMKVLFPIAAVMMFINSLTPNDNQVYKMAGAYFVTNIDGIAQLPPNLIKAANDFITDATKVEKPVKKESKDNDSQ